MVGNEMKEEGKRVTRERKGEREREKVREGD